jgi:hypothetical protein
MSVSKRHHSPEHRAAISRALTGKKKSAEHLAKIGDAMRGRTLSSEARAAISAGVKLAMARRDVQAKVLAGQVARNLARGRIPGNGWSTRHKRFYDALFEQQGGVCGICGRPPQKQRLHMDHNHSCCKRGCEECIRGLLCSRCNLMVGFWETFIRDHLVSIRNWTSRA